MDLPNLQKSLSLEKRKIYVPTQCTETYGPLKWPIIACEPRDMICLFIRRQHFTQLYVLSLDDFLIQAQSSLKQLVIEVFFVLKAPCEVHK